MLEGDTHERGHWFNQDCAPDLAMRSFSFSAPGLLGLRQP